MSEIAYYNGNLAPYNSIKIPLSDRAVFFGDGIYDAALCARGKIFLSDRHIKRFLGNAERLEIRHDFDYAKLEKILYSVLGACDAEYAFLYFQLTRGCKERIHSSLSSDASNLLVTVKPCECPSPRLMRLHIREDLRYYYCDIKTINLLPQTLYATEAARLGLDECVLHRNNIVTECSHSNISIIKDDTLITHPRSRLILPGITRECILEACERLGIPYLERPFSVNELYLADDIIVSSSSRLACPAVMGSEKRKKTDIGDAICGELKKQFVEFAL